MKIDMVTVTPEQVLRIQDNFLSFIEWSTTDKKYHSPDKAKTLKLDWVIEIPWGPSLYLAKLYENIQSGQTRTLRNFSHFLLGRKKYIEPQDFKNPWSSDSKYVALIEAQPNKILFTANIYDVKNNKVIPMKRHRGFLNYYAWSPDNKSYLFGDLKTIYQFSLESKSIRIVYEASDHASKHCYFDETGQFLYILKDNNTTMQILSSDSLAVVSEIQFTEFLDTKQTIDISLWDPFEQRVILGANIYALEGKKVLCKKWMGIKWG